MARIINNEEWITPMDVQQSIQNALANMGYEGDVKIGKEKEYDEGTIYTVSDENDTLLFTIDSDCIIAN